MDNIFNELCETLDKQRVLKDEPMNKHTTFKIGGNADLFVKIVSIDELQQVLKIVKQHNIPITIMGNGSNLLVKDNGIRGIVIKIDMQEYAISLHENKYIVTAQAGVKLTILAQKLLQKGITGFEFASGIPGTIGGAIKMNAGAYGKEMCNIVQTTKYLDLKNGIIKELTNQEQQFEYRKSIFSKHKEYIILETTLELQQGIIEEIQEKMHEYATKRKENQPLEHPSAGSTFKRIEGYITAKLIDECGLKGYTIGDAQISTIHAGFIINKGNATAKQVLDLVEYVTKEVYEKFNVNIQLEIEVVGE